MSSLKGLPIQREVTTPEMAESSSWRAAGVLGELAHVDDGVGDGPAAGVDLLHDVDALVSEEGGDLTQDTGLVPVNNA